MFSTVEDWFFIHCERTKRRYLHNFRKSMLCYDAPCEWNIDQKNVILKIPIVKWYTQKKVYVIALNFNVMHFVCGSLILESMGLVQGYFFKYLIARLSK
jgi:hypothetical protein